MRPILVLALAILGISFSGPLVRLSAADPLVIAIWRVGLSLVIIAIALVLTGEWRQWRALGRRDVAIALGAGTMLAIHFWTWNASVGLTTVAASVVLVNLHPAIVAVLSALWLRERPDPQQRIGIALALAGALVVAVGDAGLGAGFAGRRALLGDLLAVVGAITVAVYYVSGRRLRQSLHLWAYVGLVYSACFVVSVAIALARGLPILHQPPRELAIFASLALGLTVLGIASVVSFTVAQRTPEIGVRIALGAEPGTIHRMVLGDGLKLAVPGLLAGGVLALAVAQIARSMLFQISPADPATFAAVITLVLGVAMLACYIPARRAARVDPLSAIRAE